MNVNEITWGDTIRIVENAPAEFRPGELGAVCGIRENDFADSSQEEVAGYTVEFGDGTTIEVSKDLVEKIED